MGGIKKCEQHKGENCIDVSSTYFFKNARLSNNYDDVIIGRLIISSVQKPGSVKMPNTDVLKSSVTSHIVLFTKAT